MILNELLKNIPTITIEGVQNTEITGIAYDSRQVQEGNLFVCIKGFETDGHKYLPSAIANGARAVIVQDDAPVKDGVTKIRVENSRQALSLVADNFYGHPSHKMNMIGITGTNGKTTSTYLIDAIFRANGDKTGIIGTIRYKIGDKFYPAVRTTPESVDIHQLFAQMLADSVETAIMEVSSHALALDRVLGIDFDVAIFTNLTRDHLDFHETFEAYRDAKLKLFRMLADPSRQKAVINFDDRFSEYFAEACAVPVIGFGIDARKDVYPKDYELSINGTKLLVATPAGDLAIEAKLRGKSNVYNILTAIATAIAKNVSLDAIKAGIESVENVAGRFESVDCGQPFGVIVDYAHTPDALERLLETVLDIGVKRLITVFGCGGDRDRGKRPQMGEIVTRLSDIAVVTSDNPRTEEPMAIIDDILEGVLPNSTYEVEPDRRTAIKRAIEIAESGDVVVIAGKGHEDYQILGKTKIHFDDREEARKAIEAT